MIACKFKQKNEYKNNFSKSSTEHILRLGYVSIIDKDWTAKVFAIKGYIYPTFRQTTFSPNTNINPDLESIKSRSITAEIIYKLNNTTFTVSGGEGKVNNSIVFSPTLKKYVNINDTNVFYRGFIKIDHTFDLNNKLTIEYFKLSKEKYFTSGEGGLIQLFNKVGKFDIYNELVYRSDYTTADNIDMPACYDYTLGIIYPVNRQLEIKLKGENLLDMAHEVPINGVDVPVMERRALLTMEYTF